MEIRPATRWCWRCERLDADEGETVAVSGVWHDEAEQAWLLEMRSTGYAFGLVDDGAALRHLCWGAALPRAAVCGLAAAGRAGQSAWERRISWGRELPDEYVPWGGLRFDEPSVKAEFADGTRGVEWRFAGHRVSRRGGASTLELDLTDAAYGLKVTLWYRIFDGFDVIERWAAIRNAGDRPVVIRQAHSANWWMPAGRRWRLRYLHGGWAAETQLAETTLGPGKLVLESRRGTTSHQLNPWFTLDPDGAATEDHGEVWSGALAWSGSWKIVCETTTAGRVHACGGLNDFDWAHELAAGEELVLPPFAGLYTAGGFGAASREWHAWQRTHVLGRGERTGVATPRFVSAGLEREAAAADPGGAGTGGDVTADGPPLRPVLYNSWEATGFAVTEDGQARLAEVAARLGVECFVVDDGWFAGREHDRAGLGDWTPDRAKFPRGLTPLIERAGALGMRFGLWVEPEMVNPDSDLYRAHPDWVYHFENRSRTEQRNQLVLNLARPGRDPGGVHPGLPGPGHGGLGYRQPELPDRARAAAVVPVPRGHGRRPRHRRRPAALGRGRAGRGGGAGRPLQADPPGDPARPPVPDRVGAARPGRGQPVPGQRRLAGRGARLVGPGPVREQDVPAAPGRARSRSQLPGRGHRRGALRVRPDERGPAHAGRPRLRQRPDPAQPDRVGDLARRPRLTR
jgi:Glycosyl hydrolase family 36 N-terminal domain/Melibiase